jgi:hypothetical protein
VPWSERRHILKPREPERGRTGAALGTNKRYADSIDRRMGERAAETVMRGKQPETLTPTELELTREPLTRTPVARPVRAWVHYGAVALLVEAEAVAWTEHAVAIRWQSPEGEHRAWVWASAVRGR